MDVKNYGIGICNNEDGYPVCIIISHDSLEKGGDIAINAEKARLIGEDLYLSFGNEVLVIKGVDSGCSDLLKNGLPLVVIDPKRNREKIIYL